MLLNKAIGACRAYTFVVRNCRIYKNFPSYFLLENAIGSASVDVFFFFRISQYPRTVYSHLGPSYVFKFPLYYTIIESVIHLICGNKMQTRCNR